MPGRFSRRGRRLPTRLASGAKDQISSRSSRTSASMRATARRTGPSTTTSPRCQRVLHAELSEFRRLGRLRVDHREGDRADEMVWFKRRRRLSVGRGRAPVAWNDGCVLSHRGCASRNSLSEIRHLEYRWCGRHRQAVGRPDRNDQPEVAVLSERRPASRSHLASSLQSEC